MDQFRKSLIEELMLTLKIPQGNFNYSTIEDEIRHIQNDNLKEFYKTVMSADSFGNGMKAIIESAKKFKPQEDDLLKGTHQKAKDMYNKFYSENCSMTNYTQANRDKVKNDREFFENMKYEDLEKNDGTKTYNAQELYVLNELGGGTWLIDIRFLPNTQVAISKIEKIIKTAIITKYSTSAIENKRVRSLVGKTK
jgi:hypothetical protein